MVETNAGTRPDDPATGRAAATRRRLFQHRPPPGAAPGTIVADPEAPHPVIRVVAYGPDELQETTISDAGEAASFVGQWPVVWVNVDGLGDVEVIRELGRLFDIHTLALEDVVNVYQRPKVEDYGEHLFLVTRMVQPGSPLETEQVSLFLGRGYILTFQERPGDSFDPVRERLRRSGGRIRGRGPDYLAYALLDANLDAYFPLLENLSEHVETLQREVIEQPAPDSMARIHEINRDLITLRRAVWPQREMMSWLSREAEGFVEESTRAYLRDTYDHCVQLIDLIETSRELTRGLSDLYLTTATTRTNEIMRVLTMVATLFIPLSFIASVYGMNFDPEASPFNMPELTWAFGYPYALLLMATVAAGLLGYFYRHGWIRRLSKRSGRPRHRRERQV